MTFLWQFNKKVRNWWFCNENDLVKERNKFCIKILPKRVKKTTYKIWLWLWRWVNFLTNTIREYWAQFYKKGMEMWWVRISPYFLATSFESHLNLPAKRNLDVRCQMPQCRCLCSAGHLRMQLKWKWKCPSVQISVCLCLVIKYLTVEVNRCF